MPELKFEPPIPPARTPAAADSAFVQSIRLITGPDTIGQAHWSCATDPAHGVAQVLDLAVSPAHRRQEHGRRLMEAITAQASLHFKNQGSRLRRLWVSVEQERQVVGRSFLMQFGFHHVGTVQELLKGQDLLVYMRTFD